MSPTDCLSTLDTPDVPSPNVNTPLTNCRGMGRPGSSRPRRHRRYRPLCHTSGPRGQGCLARRRQSLNVAAPLVGVAIRYETVKAARTIGGVSQQIVSLTCYAKQLQPALADQADRSEFSKRLPVGRQKGASASTRVGPICVDRHTGRKPAQRVGPASDSHPRPESVQGIRSVEGPEHRRTSDRSTDQSAVGHR